MNTYTHERAAMIAEGTLIDLMQDDGMRRIVTGLNFPPTACTIEALNIIQDSFGLYDTLCGAREGRDAIQWRSIVPITLFEVNGSEDHLIYMGGNDAGTIAGHFEAKTRLRLTGTNHDRQVLARLDTLAQNAAKKSLAGGDDCAWCYYLDIEGDIADVAGICLSIRRGMPDDVDDVGFQLTHGTVANLASGAIRLVDFLPDQTIETLFEDIEN